MVAGKEADEIRRMCMVLFCELQDIRQRLDIVPLGLRDEDAYREKVKTYVKLFEDRMSAVEGGRSGREL